MQKADDVLAELVVDIADKQKVLEAIAHLQHIHPDLKVQRSGLVSSLTSIKFSSSDANKVSEGVDIITRTDMFLDRKPHEGTRYPEHFVEAWPYSTMDGYKVYSDPPSFTIGKVNTNGFGIEPMPYWEDMMDEADIAIEAIRAARSHLKKNPAIHYHLQNNQE